MDLPTMGVGSYAAPGWLFLFREAMRAGRTGAEDVEEAFDDATRIPHRDCRPDRSGRGHPVRRRTPPEPVRL